MEYKLRDMSWSEFAERSKTAKTIILRPVHVRFMARTTR